MVYSGKDDNLKTKIEMIKIVTGIVAMLVGLIVIICGLKYSIDIFSYLFGAIKDPQKLEETLELWSVTLGGEAFSLSFGKKVIPLSMIMSTMVLGGGVLILAWLALAMMQTGAKIVSLTMGGDRSAVKNILQHAYGNSPRSKKKMSLTKNQDK